MLVGRVVTGVGNGLNTSTIPVYQNEVSKAKYRGRAVVIEMATNIFGVMLAYWVDYGLRNYQTDVQWRLRESVLTSFCFRYQLTVLRYSVGTPDRFHHHHSVSDYLPA